MVEETDRSLSFNTVNDGLILNFYGSLLSKHSVIQISLKFPVIKTIMETELLFDICSYEYSHQIF